MPLDDFYVQGTITVTADDVTVTGAGVVWSDVYRGDELRILSGANAGMAIPIESVDQDDYDVLELQVPWPGGTLAGADYMISKRATSRLGPTGDVLERILKFVTDLQARGLFHFTEVVPPDPQLGEDDQWALYTPGAAPWRLWHKENGIWVEQSPPTFTEQLQAVERAETLLAVIQAHLATAQQAQRRATATARAAESSAIARSAGFARMAAHAGRKAADTARMAESSAVARTAGFAYMAAQAVRKVRDYVDVAANTLAMRTSAFAALASQAARRALRAQQQADASIATTAAYTASSAALVRQAKTQAAAAAASAAAAAISADEAEAAAGAAAVDDQHIKIVAEIFTN